MTKTWLGVLCAALLTAGSVRAAGFELKDTAGQHLDVLLDGKIVARYMYANDTSTKERAHETYKTYLHVFDAEGKAPITKGPGGFYTHHRGIFIGWTKLGFGGKSLSFWTMGSGRIEHQKFLDQKAGEDQATFTSLTHWNTTDAKRVLVEERTHTIRRGADGFRLVIDFASKLQAPDGEVQLKGDPEHAGVHYRPANEVDKTKTAYVYPKENAEPHKDLDYPWVGESYTLDDKRYSVVEMSHPDNPKGTRWSAYRDYGRFGAFPTGTIPQGQSLTLKYRFLVADGEMPSVEQIHKACAQFAGASAAGEVPKTTVRPAEGGAAKKAPAKKK